MPPGDPIVVAANTALADPNVRQTVKEMHAQGLPLLQMVDALGLDDDMSARIRQIVQDLPPDVVDEIRRATLAMLETTDYAMPIDCKVSDAQLEAGLPVVVDVPPIDGTLTIRVRPAS